MTVGHWIALVAISLAACGGTDPARTDIGDDAPDVDSHETTPLEVGPEDADPEAVEAVEEVGVEETTADVEAVEEVEEVGVEETTADVEAVEGVEEVGVEDTTADVEAVEAVEEVGVEDTTADVEEVSDPCGAVTCNTPPAPRCEGDNVVVSVSAGACNQGVCSYAAVEVPCGGGCLEGACVANPCAGVVCDDSPDLCHAATGTCSQGVCSYAALTGASCNDGNACTTVDVCTAGICAGAPRACTAPPAPTCRGVDVRVSYAATGTCGGSGACSYAETLTSCPFGCAAGACQPDPCAGGLCDPPVAMLVCAPSSAEVGDLVTFVGSASYDDHGPITDYRFAYGDGQSDSGLVSQRQHAYAAAGDFVITLTVTNDRGHRAAKTCSVSITAPVVGTLGFAPPIDSATVHDVDRLTATDLDDDGILDLLYGGQDFGITYGHGDGRFVVSRDSGVPDAGTVTWPTWPIVDHRVAGDVAVADIDADGDDDVVTAVVYSSGLWVQLGTGDGLTAGSFIPATVQGGGGKPLALAIADFDGDTRLDVVTASTALNFVTFLKGDGAGGFVGTRLGSSASAGRGTGPVAVALGDVDGDHVIDAVTANYTDQSLSLVRGAGSGTFRAAVVIDTVATGCGWPSRVVLADLDDDQDSDAIVACAAGSVALFEASGGTLLFKALVDPDSGGSNALRFAEMTGDDHLDIVIARGSGVVSVYPGQATPFAFGAAMTVVGQFPIRDITVADVDGDEVLDVVAVGSCGCILQENGMFGQTLDHARLCAFRGLGGGQLERLECEVIRDFEHYADMEIGSGVRSIAALKIDGDGYGDVVVSVGQGNIRTGLGLPSGRVARATPLFAFDDGELGAFDFDGDGRKDPYVLGTDRFTWFDEAWGYRARVVAGNSFWGSDAWLALGQIDADPEPEIFGQSYAYNGDLNLFNGGTYWAVGVSLQRRFPPVHMVVADVNGDGTGEGVAVGRSSNPLEAGVTVLNYADSIGYAPMEMPLASASPPTRVAVGAVGYDDLVDIVALQPALGRVSILFAVGAGAFATATSASFVEEGVEETPIDVVVGDFNGDGAGDIATANRGSNRLVVHSGASDEVLFVQLAATPTAVTAGDFDNDGVDDIMVAIGPKVSVYLGIAAEP